MFTSAPVFYKQSHKIGARKYGKCLRLSEFEHIGTAMQIKDLIHKFCTCFDFSLQYRRRHLQELLLFRFF